MTSEASSSQLALNLVVQRRIDITLERLSSSWPSDGAPAVDLGAFHTARTAREAAGAHNERQRR